MIISQPKTTEEKREETQKGEPHRLCNCAFAMFKKYIHGQKKKDRRSQIVVFG